MATLSEQVALAANREFSARLIAGAVNVALEVLAEPQDVHGNSLRRSLALGILGNPDGYELRFAYAVLADARTYTSQLTAGRAKTDATADKDLLDRLRAVWNLMANVPPAVAVIPGGDLPPDGVG